MTTTTTATATSAPWMGKKFRMVSSNNFQEFLKARGVGLIGRKMADSVTPTVSLTVDDDGLYTFHTFSTFKNSAYTFRLDEEFDEETPDGRTVRSIISLADNRMVHRQLGDQPTLIERTFSETDVTVSMVFKDVVCTRRYEVVV